MILRTATMPTARMGPRVAARAAHRLGIRSQWPGSAVGLATTQSATLRRKALQHVEIRPCPVCGGAGLRPEALAVTYAGANIAELTTLCSEDGISVAAL